MPDLSISPRWPSALVTDFFRARRFDGGKYGEGPVCNRAFLFFGLAVSEDSKARAFHYGIRLSEENTGKIVPEFCCYDRQPVARSPLLIAVLVVNQETS